MAIGVGEMRTVDKATGIIDGDAIYKSGRKIASYSTSGKERIRIKNTLFYVSDDPRENRIMEALLSFADVLYKKATPKQMQVLYYKLQGKTDADIAEALGYRISTINKHGLLLGWNAIAEMLDLYENTLFAK
jgi:DNA-directed RNA polymerase specialized sigma24 family protein